MKKIFILAILLTTTPLYGKIEFPDFTSDEIDRITKTLSPAVTPNPLSSLIPLGGYSGLELGLSVSLVDISPIPSLEKSLNEKEFYFPRITLGKGLFHDVDIFLSITPNVTRYTLSDYAASIRWSFLELSHYDLNFSVIPYFSSLELNHELFLKNQGVGIYMNWHRDFFDIYFGIKQNQGKTTFQLKTSELDVKKQGISKKLLPSLGLVLHKLPFFLSFHANKLEEIQYSLKIGLRF